MSSPDTRMIESTVAVFEKRRTCCNPDCDEVIETGEPCIRDEAHARVYCPPCGKRLRYHRRKALERGEDSPRDFQAVDKRHEHHRKN